MSQGKIAPIEVFCSYAHADEVVVQTVLAALEPLVQQGLLTIWSDRRIFAGREWVNEIDLHLNTSQIILLFASPAFLSSRYCMQVEVPRALERAQRREAHLIPIVLSPIELSIAPFGHLQALPPGGQPLNDWEKQDEANAAIASHLETLAKRLLPHAEVPVPRARLLGVPFRRNPYFTGREDILEQLHRSLAQHHTSALVQAIVGLGGIGKTQTAVEYVYRYQGEYDMVLWVNAESQETLVVGYGRLAHLLILPERDEQEQECVTQAVVRWMQMNRNWLLVLDNVDDTKLLEGFLPQTEQGHVLQTTRSQMVGGHAALVPVDAMDQETGALLLLRRAKLFAASLTLYNPSLPPQIREDALALSEELGGLPLALDQAGAYIEETKCGLAEYLRLYQAQYGKQLRARRGRFGNDHPASVVTTFALCFERVMQESQVAAELLRASAFVAPDAIPDTLLQQDALFAGTLLEQGKTNPLLLNETISILGAYSLIKRDVSNQVWSVHRLVQTVMRDAMTQEEQRQWALRAVLAVNAAFPKVEHRYWPACEQMLPHVFICVKWIEKYTLQQEGIGRLLNQAAAYLQERARYSEAVSLTERALVLTEELSGPDHVDTARLLNNLSHLYRSLGRYVEAEPLCQRALAIDEKTYGPGHPAVAMVLNNLANVYQDQGRVKEAEPLYVRSLDIREKQLGPMHPDVAIGLNNLANLYEAQGRLVEAERLYQRALAIWEEQLGDNHPSIAMGLNNLASIYHNQGRLAEAELLYSQALTIVEKQLGPEHPNTISSLNNLAELYREQGKYSEAEPLYQRSLVIKEKQWGENHPSIATGLNNLALLYLALGRLSEAEPLYVRSLGIYERQLGSEHSDVANSLNNLASLYKAQGRFSEAERLYSRVLAIVEKQLGPEHPNTISTLNNLAELYREQGKLVEAEPLYQRALAIDKKQLGSEHPDVATDLNDLAGLYQEQGKYAEAEPLYVRALAIDEKVHGPEHPEVATDLNNLAGLYQKQGRLVEAEPLSQRSLEIREKQLGPEHPDTALSRWWLAVLAEEQGKLEEAKAGYEQALGVFERVLGPEHPRSQNLRGYYERCVQRIEASH